MLFLWLVDSAVKRKRIIM